MQIKKLSADDMITAPGLYRMPANAYHADPCPDASLNQTIAKILLSKSPRHAWTAHPKLNVNHAFEEEQKFDLGSAAHMQMLGEGNEIKVGQWDDWRKKEAQVFRDSMRAQGFTPLLEHQYERVCLMVGAARNELGDIFDSRGQSEVIIAAREETFWLRTMIDWIAPDGTCYDYKTTDMSVAPDNIPRIIVNMGWHIQAAFHDRLLHLVEPDTPRKYRFIAQETAEPFALVKVEMTEDWMTIGRKEVERAVFLWKSCIATGQWPAYPRGYVYPPIPGWYEQNVLNREIHDAAEQRHPMIDSLAGG